MAKHGPKAVRRVFPDYVKVPSHWVRMAMAGCEKCAEWTACRRRVSAMHRAYARRRR